ncbi:MAG: hypothetical protein KDC93_15125 [Cyclobacteriaceae bacterium]|nr:hypothetical protein [Cyclobacteriaceae bacterium]
MRRIKIIALTSALVGTLDGLAAVLQFKLRGGQNPFQVFRFIASGLFGREAFTDPILYPVLGIVLHYIIAATWTTLFFLYYPRMRYFWVNTYIAGVIYAIVIWSIMNLIIIPLSNTPPLPQSIGSSLVEMFILVCAVGLPISWIYHKSN